MAWLLHIIGPVMRPPVLTQPSVPRKVSALTIFVAISAIAGGIELVVYAEGNQLIPLALLENTPFQTFLIPGLLLGGIVGIANLVASVLIWRRSRGAPDATVLAGGALTIWILAEVALMRQLHWLHGLYGGLGLSILLQGLWRGWRSRVRSRWVIGVTLAETMGYLAPAIMGLFTTRLGIEGAPQVLLMTAAGSIEGLVLGTGQAWVMPLPVHRARYALLTAAGAAAVWAAVMTMMQVFQSEPGPFVSVVLGVIGGAVGLVSIGGLQWLELRHHTRRAYRWILWTALAWVVALPLSFTPGPLVDESTPLSSHLVLWACGGWLMAYVMALITWQGAKRLPAARAYLGAILPMRVAMPKVT